MSINLLTRSITGARALNPALAIAHACPAVSSVVEHPTDNRKAAGSNPAPRTRFQQPFRRW